MNVNSLLDNEIVYSLIKVLKVSKYIYIYMYIYHTLIVALCIY